MEKKAGNRQFDIFPYSGSSDEESECGSIRADDVTKSREEIPTFWSCCVKGFWWSRGRGWQTRKQHRSDPAFYEDGTIEAHDRYRCWCQTAASRNLWNRRNARKREDCRWPHRSCTEQRWLPQAGSRRYRHSRTNDRPHVSFVHRHLRHPDDVLSMPHLSPSMFLLSPMRNRLYTFTISQKVMVSTGKKEGNL